MTKREVAAPPAQGQPLKDMLGQALGAVKTMQYTLQEIHDYCKNYADAPTLSKATSLGIIRRVEELAALELARPLSSTEPDVEVISAKVHEQWMESKRAKGVSSRKLESGEELIVPYAQLSEEAKELDRGSVKAVLAALASLTAKERNNG